MFQFTHPVWGATCLICSFDLIDLVFQFTHPVWGATGYHCNKWYPLTVSIHAPRVGCDLAIECIPFLA